ncbi:response regulator [Sphingomonas sp. HF-S3]|uniref:Response regulator n=1 Tax=Sphingomonas rustica TaxID=3103142 RepID=A0ABV0B9L5_9SPHN
MTEHRLIHIVDDEETIRKSASFMLSTSGFEVESYEDGVAFLEAASTAKPGCILLDVRMPQMGGLEVQAELNRRGIDLPVIVLTGHGDISTAVAAMKGGAVDFIEKPFEKAKLLDAIDRAFERLDQIGEATSGEHEARNRLSVLTGREVDVLRGLVRGHPNKTIAFDLGISPRTVEVHRANLMAKLGVRSLSEALRIAFAARLEDDEE